MTGAARPLPPLPTAQQKPVRVLVLATFLTRDQAGAAHSIITIIRSLARSGWAEVTVAAHTWDPDALPKNVQVIRLPAESWPSPFWRLFPLTHYWHARRVLRDARLGDFDLCYTQSTAYGLAYRERHPTVPLVSHTGFVLWDREVLAESSAPMRWRRFQAWLARRLERRSYGSDRWVHLASSRLVATIRADAFSLDPDAFVVAPLPVDPDRFDPGRRARDVRRELEIAPDAFCVIAVARLVPMKHIDDVIRAAASMNPRPFVIVVGDGPERSRLEQLAGDLALTDRVRFVGRQDPADYLAGSDVLVVPSTVESYGLVYVEAMMMGLPAIGRRFDPPHALSAASEVIVEGEVGFCVGDTTELGERMQALQADRQRCRSMGERARRLAIERYTPDHYLSILRQIMTRVGQYSSGSATRVPSRADR